jgi:hypothetical protein
VPFHRAVSVAAEPVLVNVEQFNGEEPKLSFKRPEVIVSALFDAVQLNSVPRSRACCPPDVVDIRGENEIVPDSWHVTAPGAGPR